MNHDWRGAIRHTLFAMAAAGFIGWAMGSTAWGIALFSIGYLIWHFRQLHRLQDWLISPEADDPPDSHGIWGQVFDDVYRLQRRQKKSRQRLKAVLKRVQDSTAALKDGVIMVDSNGALEWWNASASQLLGLNEKQDIAQPITNLLRDPEFKAYFEQTEYDNPLEIASPVNHEMSLQFQITLFGRKDRLILCKDVTHLKQLEAMRQDFVANASHELRTPLTVISGYLETFIDYKDTLPSRWGRALTQMHQQSQRMQGLIDDLLLLSRIESSDGTTHEKILIPSMLNRIKDDALALSAGKHVITLDCDDINLEGVEAELSSAFSNLIFNAVKYTPENGEINIRWYENSRGLFLEVKDNGIGIDSRHLPRLTERFYRADPSRHSDTGGTGLGLAIVKHVLLHHEAQLDIRSVMGKGSTFMCHFPPHKKHEDA
jgi:two-component system phosphate regulon sensor histidine kinase PhoR